MTTGENTMSNNLDRQGLLSGENVKAYILAITAIAAVIGLYYILTGPTASIQPPRSQPSTGPPGQSPPPVGGPGLGLLNSWPLWGQLVFPSVLQLIAGIVCIIAFGFTVNYIYNKKGTRSSILLIVIIGVILIITTNLLQGWETGITQTFGGATEIFGDMVRVDGFFDFISNYETIQPTLTTHARTQPPGAVLFIYLLYLGLGSPDLIAIALCVIAAVGSAFFVRGIFRHLFDDDYARYTTLLYLILPAVQVYYLANIYAIVATLTIGVLYFYLHSDRRVALGGSFLCLFFLTFITFLSVFMVFFLFIYEILTANSEGKIEGFHGRLKVSLKSIQSPLILSLAIGTVYGLLQMTFGFNLVNAFLYASSLENPNGFMLLTSPIEYFVTRLQNVLDIIIFFGPVLSVLAYRGFIMLREEANRNPDSLRKYNLLLAAIIALGLLFLAGAPKKGETARICMFILPFLLIPVTTYIQRTNMNNRNKAILLLLVFGQTVLMQLFGIWVW